ncbi:MAG TPA: efflux RND transporter periplasmic adaptor subunit, partial [Methylophilaceae bacterium]|nr:efflux RND transporter periplasmic adaptor subunit [Methylophilaceae bacterium]
MPVSSLFARFSTRSIAAGLLLALLAGCDVAKEAVPAPAQQPVDPNVVELSTELQKQIELATVGLAEVRELLRIPGSIQVDEQRMARIGAPVTGRITEIDVVLGQEVKQGQVLASLNSTELAQ